MSRKPTSAVMVQRRGLAGAKRLALEVPAPVGVGGSAPRQPAGRMQGAADPRYGSYRWKQLRAKVKRERPRCEGECEGFYATAYPDHVIEVTDDTSDENFFSEANLKALCPKCHYRKTKREAARRAGRPEPKFGPLIRGCDVHGMPLDPNHPWRKE